MKFSCLLTILAGSNIIQLTTSSSAHHTLRERQLIIVTPNNAMGNMAYDITSRGSDAYCTMVAKAMNTVLDDTDGNVAYVFGDSSTNTRLYVNSYLIKLHANCLPAPGFANVYIWPDEAYYASFGRLLPWPSCNNANALVPSPYLGYGDYDGNLILCSAFYIFPSFPTSCWAPSSGSYLVRLLLLEPSVTNTGPPGSPGSFSDRGFFGPAVLLSPSQERLTIPDAYAYYVSNVWLGCINGALPPTPVSTPAESSVVFSSVAITGS